jgi:hypothetical protein
MSPVRLCLAGVLVAAGLILGGFTLHGYFDPQWEAKQSRTTDTRPAAPAKAVPAQHGRSRFVAREERSPAVPARMTTTTPAVPPLSAAKVAAPPPKSSAPRKKVVAEKPKQTPSQQQASFLWPWNPFSN